MEWAESDEKRRETVQVMQRHIFLISRQETLRYDHARCIMEEVILDASITFSKVAKSLCDRSHGTSHGFAYDVFYVSQCALGP